MRQDTEFLQHGPKQGVFGATLHRDLSSTIILRAMSLVFYNPLTPYILTRCTSTYLSRECRYTHIPPKQALTLLLHV